MRWTKEKLSDLANKKGFRQRGEQMTRIEIFSDAAFAFAVTMLVISLSDIPRNYAELQDAIKGIPAFIISFSVIMSFWLAHRRWSSRYGLDDVLTTGLILILISEVLVYVYPLKLMISFLLSVSSGGFFPSAFEITSAEEMTGLVIFFGLGVFSLTLVLALLYLRAYSQRENLLLTKFELLTTKFEIYMNSSVALVALLSAAFALMMPAAIAVYGGFVFTLIPVVSAFIGIHFGKRIKALENRIQTDDKS